MPRLVWALCIPELRSLWRGVVRSPKGQEGTSVGACSRVIASLVVPRAALVRIPPLPLQEIGLVQAEPGAGAAKKLA